MIVSCDLENGPIRSERVRWDFLFLPLLLQRAAYGAVKQSRLPEEIFAEIEKFIVYGGNSVVVSMGGRLKENEIDCPVCKAKNPKGQKFCKECGAKLGKDVSQLRC